MLGGAEAPPYVLFSCCLWCYSLSLGSGTSMYSIHDLWLITLMFFICGAPSGVGRYPLEDAARPIIRASSAITMNSTIAYTKSGMTLVWVVVLEILNFLASPKPLIVRKNSEPISIASPCSLVSASTIWS